MMKSEFENLAGREVTDEQYRARVGKNSLQERLTMRMRK